MDLDNPGTVAHLQFRLGSRVDSPNRVLLGHWPHHSLQQFDRGKFGDANDEKTRWNVPLVSMQFLHDRGRLEDGSKPPKDSAVTGAAS